MAYTYDGCCGSCIHMNTNDYVGHKGHCYCTYRRQYYNLDESKCSYYRYDPNKDYYDLNHRWHVVSAVMQIFQTSAECLGITELHNFRIDVLEKDSRYEKMLQTYDVVGPFLANQLLHDHNAIQLCSKLLENWLKPVNSQIVKGNVEEAVHQYARMIDFMLMHYGNQFRIYCEIKKVSGTEMLMEERI